MRQIDELQSIQRFIGASIPGALADKPKIYLERPRPDTARPYFIIENPAGPRSILTPQWYRDMRIWIVTYKATTRADIQNRGDLWVQKIYNDPKYKFRIPMWLFDLPYFPAKLYLKDDVASTLAVGSYSVQIVAENDLGQVTKPSAVTTIAVPATGKSIIAYIPREPKGWPIGYRFHVYLSGSPTSPTVAHRIGSVVYTGKVDPTFTISHDVPNGTAQGNATALMSGLAVSSQVRFRYLEVVNDSVDTQVLEDPDTDGVFNYIVRFQTSAPGMREYPHGQAVNGIQLAVEPTF